MAKTRINTVPLGKAGTGSAYILPDSRALNNLIQNVEYNRKQGLLNVKARNDYNEKQNKDFLDNQLKVKGGILYQDELNKATQNWIDKGAQYRAEGFNPFNPNPSNPDEVAAASEFMKERARIESMADTRGVYEKNFLAQQDAYEKGGVDEDSWVALNDFYKNNTLADLTAGGVTPPTLMKAFDQAAFMKGIKAPSVKFNTIDGNLETTRVTPNVGAIRLGVETALSSNPQAMRNFNKNIARINPAETPAKTIIGSTDPAEISSFLDGYYKSPEGAAEALKAFPAGTVPSFNSPAYQKFIADATRKQLAAETKYDQGLDTLVDQKAAEVNEQNIKKYNFDANKEARAADAARMARGRYGWAAENQGWKRQDRKLKDAAANKRDEFIQGLQVGNKDQVMNLRQLAKSKGGRVGYEPDGSLNVTWKEKAGGGFRDRQQIIDLNEVTGEGYAQLNELLTTLTGKKVDLESLQAKEPYTGGLVDVGEASLTKDQIKYIRDSFGNNYKSLGDFLIKQGAYKNRSEAYKAAADILDPKGRANLLKQK